MADYIIQSGDNLWNIAKNQLGLTSNADIQNAVNEIAASNNIKDANKIYAGQSINISIFEEDEAEAKQADDKPAAEETEEKADSTEVLNDTYNEFENWQSKHADAMLESSTIEEYEEAAQEIGNEYDFMEGQDVADEQAYSTQTLKLAQGHVEAYDKDGSGELEFTEYLDSETRDEFDRYVQMVKNGELDKNEAIETITTAVAAAATVYNIIDQKMGDGNDKVSDFELQQYYQYVDSFDNEERVKDGKINIDATTNYPLYLAQQVEISDEAFEKAFSYASSLFAEE